MTEKWKTDKWYVSPWNFADEVTKDFVFKDKIKFHDVTLRDGEQQAGIVFTKDEKVNIAEKLAEAGVHRIEAGMPAVSKSDEMAIKEIVKRKLGPEVFAFCRCMVDDVKRALDCGVDGIVIEIPSSDHMIKYAYRWELEKAIRLSIESTQFAKENGLYTVFFPIDATRADVDWFLDLIVKIEKEGHMDALAVVDTFGVLAPHTVPYLIKKIKERVSKPLETHFHDDFGCGAANTLMALAAGADVAHTTVTGIGERAGNAPYEEIALSLKLLYGVDTGIKTEKFFEISKYVQECSRLTVRPNRQIVGPTVFNIESGIIADWLNNAWPDHKLEVTPFLPEIVGQKDPEIVLGKNSGIPSVEKWLEKLGLPAVDSKEKKLELVMAVKDASFVKKGLLNEEDFKAVCQKVLG